MTSDAVTGVPKGTQSAEIRGLDEEEARKRLLRFGPNAIAEPRRHPLLALLAKFWAPVPWMLEVTVVLELVLHRNMEAVIIGALLAFNAALSLSQEDRARSALELLRKKLTVQARALRDGRWRLIRAEELVPGDVIHLRMGDIVPADTTLLKGAIALDRSALTGESVPVDMGSGATAHAGALVRRGEATGEVAATGAHTYFGRTAELVGSARTANHLGAIIFRIVRYLVAMDAVLVVALLVYSLGRAMPLADVLPFALILLVASVPAALPATFTLATALGALELVRRGVLSTRLSALEEAAAMDVLCSDKTGTITKNELRVAAVHPFPPYCCNDVLALAALASDDATQDPIDLAVLEAARASGCAAPAFKRLELVPFDPAAKLTRAAGLGPRGERLEALKGTPAAIAACVPNARQAEVDFKQLAAEGYRVLAVAGGPPDALQLAGLIALEDPVREDSGALVQSLGALGVRVVMVTGDTAPTALAIAHHVGIGAAVHEPGPAESALDAAALKCDVFAGVYPEDKFRLVRAFQDHGHVVGMTGDGVNDAPALKQAEVGIAVANATDVAKSAASLVLTRPGLAEVVAAVETSRRVYQRMLTYTLNKIIKTIEIAVFLSLGVILTGELVITPMLVVLLLFANDFVTMSIATDRVGFSRRPDRWQIGTLMLTAVPLAALILALSFSVFFAGRDWLGLDLARLQTLVFVTLVFTGQGTVYLVRERGHFWDSAPGPLMVLATTADIVAVAAMAATGILMAPVGWALTIALLAVCAGYLAAVDFVKVFLVRRTGYAA